MREIIGAVARQLVFSIFSDFSYIAVYVFIYFIVRARLEIIYGFEQSIYGCRRKTLRQRMEELLLAGLVTGFFGGILTVRLGIYIEPEGLQTFLIVMAVLALFNHRFVNPSYAGGLLCLYSLIFDHDRIHVPSMLVFIATMQIIESVLLYLTRKEDNIPVFIQHNGRITGAFIKQKYYAVPFILLSSSVVPYSLLANQVIVKWNTLFKADMGQMAAGTAFFLIGAISITSYSSVAISTPPEEKCRNDSIRFAVGGLVLFVLAVFSPKTVALQWAGAVFALLYRETVYRFGLYREKKKEPLYSAVQRGVRILEVIPGGPADKMKMKRGEIILNINGKPVQTEDGIRHILSGSPTFIWMHTQDPSGQIKIYEHKCYPDGVSDLGIIVVPKEWEVTYQLDEYENFTVIKNIVDRFRFIK